MLTTKVPVDTLKVLHQLLRECGNTSPYLLMFYWEARKAKVILELGMLRGRSTRAFLLGLRDGERYDHPNQFGHLWSIDHDKQDQLCSKVAIPEIQKLGLEKLLTWEKGILEYNWNMSDERCSKINADIILIDWDQGVDWIEVFRKADLASHSGTNIFVHNIIAFPELKEICFRMIHSGKYSYKEFLVKHGMGILIKR